MKERWSRIKKAWHDFFFEDGDVYFPLRLSQSDKRWILFWVSVITFCMMLVFLIIVRLSERRLMNEVAAYVASATVDEYDKIAWDLKYHLVYRQFGQDVEKYVRYIPNTTVNCPTCQEDYQSQAYLVCVNTGQLYALDVFVEGRKPEDHYGDIHMSHGFDEVSLSRLSMTRIPDDGKNTVELNRENGIVSVHNMKTLFCDGCIGAIFNAVEDRRVSEFVIFDAEKNTFYAIDDGITISIGDYILECEEKKGDYEITVKYTGE